MKNKKFLVHCSNLNIPIDESELVSVFKALTSGEVKILRRGWFNPSFFVGVTEDRAYMADFMQDKKHEIREGKVDSFPEYPDLFPALREEVKRLSASKEIA